MRKIGLKKIRESLMISKTELARLANISPMTITRIEQGLPCRKNTKRKVTLALEGTISGMKNVMSLFDMDKNEKRLGLDRRQFSYDTHIPERRSEKDRRNGLDGKLKPRTKG
ncbi:MAG: helix-turn-helix transcriptional regulator [Deltaproteobacteria bacterium]|nr:helix-turn-helix transcriptional regulator [Deltaproteobacteria bacterium]MBW2571489.1 helix-turn-helix transcriptional regulator [Deltaproteobacteria bacterium]